MAVDTKEKRASVVGINRFAGPSPIPNASKDQEWRQEVGYSYSGILAGGAPSIELGSYYYYSLLAGK